MSDSEEEVVTALDILEEEKQYEDEASALFGDFDNNICTYEKGYITRQPLYSCMTCKGNDTHAGICLACSLNCHEGHNLVELYTKRNFRCDCGNKKFPQKCNLFDSKSEFNNQNNYNHNFDGLYCICNRPYPDPENEFEEEMVQCIICEDWFHTNHMNSNSEKSDYEEFVCIGCAKQHLILQLHFKYLTSKDESLETPQDTKTCLYQDIKTNLSETLLAASPLFWPDVKWRLHVCKCQKCKEQLELEGISFITDPKDSLNYFTSPKASANNANLDTIQSQSQTPDVSFLNFNRTLSTSANNNESENNLPVTRIEKSQYEQSLEAFSKIDKVSQNEMLHQFNDMTDNLKDYLKDFANNGKVVKKDDILQFFEQQKKKQKTHHDY